MMHSENHPHNPGQRLFKCTVILMVMGWTSLMHLHGQNILIQPYLQNATPASIVIMWETDIEGQSKVLYGETPDLGLVSTPTFITTPGNKILYTASLTGLVPATRYYYKVQTGGWGSTPGDFLTPPLPSSEASCNIVLMSDMQKDGGNPNIFSNLINTSFLPYMDSTYGSPLSDHVHMAMLPGDVVDNGNSYTQWKNDLFNPGETLWRSVPSYPAIGNHEVNSVNYFNYFNLPLNGTPGYEEHWYAHDYSNVRMLSFDTNGPYRIAAQLAWLDSMLAVTCTDPDIDFVFAQMHHPFKSELWTPGEADYTGDIVERLEAFSDSCGKPTVHFFGHTHAYSRGQSRDHDHLWVNVATSGGNIDYWGEFSNQDYDEFIVSQDEYGFVMVEVTAGPQPQFVLKRLSFGDQFNPGGATLSDEVVIRKNNLPPKKPVALFPKSSDLVSALCFELQADGFSDPDGDEHGASQWQIALDSNGFANPVFESWKQYANWYNEVNLQAQDTLTDEDVTNLEGGMMYWWRVRYRDKGLEWSPWSTPVSFTTEPLIEITGNLINNPGAESGTTGWTVTTGVIESLGPLECAGTTPYAGSKYFAVGALCVEHPFASAYQNLDVSVHSALIDSGLLYVQYGAFLSDFANSDEPALAIRFLNSNNTVIFSSDTIRYRQNVWLLKENILAVPPETRTIQYMIMGKRFAGQDNDSYFDNISCKLLLSTLATCTEYIAPGPANQLIFVDRDAPGTPDGESWTTAFHTLGDALLKNAADTTLANVWIAEGTYPVTTGTERDTAFTFHKTISLFGGFAGNETLLSERNIIAHPVILTGEIGDTNTIGDNTYHVLRPTGDATSFFLDGLTIEGGHANASGHWRGGGIYIDSSCYSLTWLSNCHFIQNKAIEGSAVFNQGALILDHCTIEDTYPDGTIGTTIVNDNLLANLFIWGCQITQTCAGCPEVIRNHHQAKITVSATTTVERN